VLGGPLGTVGGLGGVRLSGSLLLHAVKPQIRMAGSKIRGFSVLNIFLQVVFVRRRIAVFVGQRFARHSIITLNPTAKVNELAAFRTEWTKGIVFPLGRFTAGWTLHESRNARRTDYSDAGRLISIRLRTNAIVPSRRMAFKRTVTLSRVEPTIEAISR